jgi:hypothetical protein
MKNSIEREHTTDKEPNGCKPRNVGKDTED